MENDLVRRRKKLKRCNIHTIIKQRSSEIKFLDLPEDVLGTILSKLPPKEIVQTSILSSKWKNIWTVYPRVRFDGVTMCSKAVTGAELRTQKFVRDVNAVIKQYHGKLVEALEVKFEFNSMLAGLLDDWIKIALSSQVKNLALDLVPAKFTGRPDPYRFPFELFDGKSMSRLQHMQLSFVSFEPPSQLCGFPNLKKLDLHMVRVTREDLQDMLSYCFNLEWLSIVRCHLDDELKVVHPLPRLLYLRVAHCEISKIEFSAMNLQTFEYSGRWIPIHLGHVLELKDARLYILEMITLECALTALPNLLPKVQSLSLQSFMSLEMPWLLGSSSKFSRLKFLQLSVFVQFQDLSNILSLASFLSTAPSIEKLDIHFTSGALSHCSELIRRLEGCKHNCLKNLYITGFAGCTDQVEFLVYIVENTPNLEVLTIDRADYFGNDEEYERRTRVDALDIAKRHLDGRISENTKLFFI